MSASQCPGCRNPLPLDAPHGLCPACLLSGALKWALSSAPPTGVEWPIPPSPGDAAQDLAAAKTRSFGDYEILGEIGQRDRKSTRLNSSHTVISYAVFCLKKKKTENDGSNLRGW